MDLLPKSYSEFRSKAYWDSFFKKRGEKEFEWYGDYQHLQAALQSCIAKNDSRILVIGCGNSNLSSHLYDAGYQSITNIDFSEIVIRDMKKKNISRGVMKWEVMNMLNMKYSDNSYDLVLDKGTLDALVSEDTEVVRDEARQMFQEIERVLVDGGRYVCISLAQEHVFQQIASYFDTRRWKMRVHRLASTPESPLTPFLIFAEKRAEKEKGENELIPILNGAQSKKVKMPQLQEALREIQWLDTVKQRVVNIKRGRTFNLELWDERTSRTDQIAATPRYLLTIVDNKSTTIGEPNKCAVFVVPVGREHEWIFSSEEGQYQLAETASFGRLIVVSMQRGHVYESLSAVQDELSPKILDMVPPSCKKRQNTIPISRRRNRP